MASTTWATTDSPEESDRACTVMPTTGRCSLTSCPYTHSNLKLVRLPPVASKLQLRERAGCRHFSKQIVGIQGSTAPRAAHIAVFQRIELIGLHQQRISAVGAGDPSSCPHLPGRPRSFRERTVRLLDTALRNRSCANARDAGRGRVWRPSSGPNGVPSVSPPTSTLSRGCGHYRGSEVT